MKHPISTALASAACLLVLAGCERAPQVAADAAQKETPDAFIERIDADMAALSREVNAAGFTQATFITPDTEYLNAKAYERYLEYFSGAVDESKRYENQQLSPKTARAIALLKLDVSAPAPKDAKKRAELTQLLTRLDAMYGSGKYCP
ncbi:MAG: M2 family metallopeptidase, partial [Steroidobacteraceae bacterium]